MKAETIHINKQTEYDSEFWRVYVHGIRYNNEYDVQIIIYNAHNKAVYNKNITCKRVSTINKIISPFGITL